jgi:hypothetical protein
MEKKDLFAADLRRSAVIRASQNLTADERGSGDCRFARIANPRDMPSRIPSAKLGEPQW